MKQTQEGLLGHKGGWWGSPAGFLHLLSACCICFVPSLQKRIAECRYWPVEICKMSMASGGKGKTSKADKVKTSKADKVKVGSGLWSSIALSGIFLLRPL